VIHGIERMLRRLLGASVELELDCARDLTPLCIDPGQIEQIILNLVVNARDAMPNGGRVTIRTSNVHLDEAYARKRVEAEPGAYVLLAVSDTGSGISDEVRDHLFEPFFTTKE